MKGCFRNTFAMIGCATVLVVMIVVGWLYRDQIVDKVRTWGVDLPFIGLVDDGHPSGRALQSARRKHRRMADPRGPDAVRLNSSEVASLVVDELDPAVQEALDSLTVSFEPGRFILEAQLMTEVWGKEQLGFFGGLLLPRESLRVSGPVNVSADRTGVALWEPDQMSIRTFPFPRAAITPIVNSLTGGSDGSIPLPVPPTVGGIEIELNGITFFRREP